MPALTLAQAQSLLDSYVEPDGDFTASLNQVLARIYSMGTYRDLTVQYSLPVVDGCITLPRDADAVLHVTVNGSPVPVRALWHDFRSAGSNASIVDMSWGLVDAGYHSTMRLLPSEGVTTLYVVPSKSVPVFVGNLEDAEEAQLLVYATDGEQMYLGEYDSGLVTFDATVTHITAIKYSGLEGVFDVCLDAMGESPIATVGTGSGSTSYRRLRVSVPKDSASDFVVHVLCKRAFIPLANDNDVTFVGNIGAIKHGLLGRIAEDNADLERADYHWKKCMDLLEEEVSSSRGAAIPRLNIDPMGTGPTARMPNFY